MSLKFLLSRCRHKMPGKTWIKRIYYFFIKRTHDEPAILTVPVDAHPFKVKALPGQLNSLRELQERVTGLCAQSLFGDALVEIANYSGSVITDPSTIGKIFSSNSLDELCRDIGVQYKNSLISAPKSEVSGTIILATQLVKAGGHVEVIKDLLRLKVLKEPVSIVLTGFLAQTDEKIISEFEATYGVDVVALKAVNNNELFTEINNALSNLAAENLLLISYNHDSLAIGAAHAGIFKNILFIHHGDHHLCLGAASKEFIHIDLHNSGFHICRKLIGHNNKYWPLTINSHSIIQNPNTFNLDGGINTCTSGRYEKFENNNYLYGYINLIPKIIESTGGTHFHIGHLPEIILNEIHQELQKCGLDISRFKYIEYVPSLTQTLVSLRIDLYISSFPLGGGKASLEAMAAGIPLLMHINYISRSHSGFDLVYKDVLAWDDESHLIEILKGLDQKLLSSHAVKSREHFKTYYAEKILINAVLNTAEDQDVNLVPDLHEYCPDQLLAYLNFKN